MKGLLLKELFMVRRTWIILAIFIVTFGFAGILSGKPIAMIMVPMIMSINSFGFLNYDEISKWQQYSIVLPYGRKTIVSSKYLSVLMLDVFSMIVVLLCYMISVCLKKTEFSIDEFSVLVFLSVISGVIFPMLIFPLYYKLNSNKARMVLMIGGGMIGGIAATLMQDNKIDIEFISINTKIIMLIILVAVALLFTLSWFLSVKIYEKRDL